MYYSQNGCTPLYYAAHYIAKHVAALLIEKGAKINLTDDVQHSIKHLKHLISSLMYL